VSYPPANADLASYVNSEVGEDEPGLGLAIKSAAAAINNRCARQFVLASSASARLFYGNGTEILRIDDCTSVTGITNNLVTVDAATWQLEPLNALSESGEPCPYEQIRRPWVYWYTFLPKATISVTATWGWPAIPDAIQQACLILAKDIWQMRDVRAGVLGFDGYGAVRVRQNSTVAELINDYRRAEAWGIA
jgi:hypothetical protein